MHNDLSVQTISLTCPNCGKQYKKVPYAAIKQFHFAFCKRCNLKFQITPQELEEALRLALGVAPQQQTPAAPAAETVDEIPAAPAVQAAPFPEQELFAEPGQQQEEFLFPDATAQDDEHAAPGLEQAIEQKLTDLAATMEETFSPLDDLSGMRQEEPGEAPAAFDAEYAEEQPPADMPAEIEIDFPAAADKGGPEEEFLDPFAEQQSAAEPFAEINEQEQQFAADLFPAPEEALAEEEQSPDDDFSLDGISIEFTEAPDAFDRQPEQGIDADALQAISSGEDIAVDYPEEEFEPDQTGDDVLEAILSQDLTAPAAPEVAAPEQLSLDDIIQQAEAAELQAASGMTDAQLTQAELPGQDGPEEAQQLLPDEIPAQDSAPPEELIAPEADLTAPDEPRIFYDSQGNALADPFAKIPTPEELFAQIQQLSEEPADEAPVGYYPEVPAADQEYAAPVFTENSDVPGQDAYREAAAIEEPFAAETGEELFDDDLLEEAPEGAAAPPQEYLKPAPADASLFDAIRQTDGSSRDISAMLKDLVQPGAEIEEGMEQFVLFTLGEQSFAIPIANVLELSLPPDMIPVPNTPAWILGICNLRGEIISVVDLKGFLSIETETHKKPTRMIVAQTRDHIMSLGLVIDRINGIQYFHVDALQPLDEPAPGISGSFAMGLCEHEDAAVVLLDLEQILQSPKMRQFQ